MSKTEQYIEEKNWSRLLSLVRRTINLANWRKDEIKALNREIQLLKAALALAEAQREKLRKLVDLDAMDFYEKH